MDPLLAAALEHLGAADTPRPLTPHHTTAWRTDHHRIKTATTPAAVTALHHEIHALTLLREAGLTHLTATHGHLGDGVWTAVSWRPGITLWAWCAPARAQGADPTYARRLREIARDAFTTLGTWHAAGWRHGDIHPDNILVTPDEGAVEFIDCDRAHHRELLPLPGPYRGGGDQGTAPEIARRLLDTDPAVHVELTAAAETYSLAAAIRWAWTGVTPATDRFAGPHASAADVLEDIATGRRRIPLADARPWADPDLEAVIEEAMNLEPAERATAGALAAFGATRA